MGLLAPRFNPNACGCLQITVSPAVINLVELLVHERQVTDLGSVSSASLSHCDTMDFDGEASQREDYNTTKTVWLINYDTTKAHTKSLQEEEALCCIFSKINPSKLH